jgi:hypothetical protein
MNAETASILIALCAFLLSFYTYWKTNIMKPKLYITTSNWSIQKITNEKKEIYPIFLVKVSVYNKSGLPSKIYDIMLVLVDNTGNKYYFRPTILFDQQKSIEVGKIIDNFGKSQKGLVPLPKIIKPFEEYDFEYQIMFTPHTTDKMFKLTSEQSNISVSIYYSSDRNKGYEIITTQKYTYEQLIQLEKVSMYTSENYEVTKKREKFVKQ